MDITIKYYRKYYNITEKPEASIKIKKNKQRLQEFKSNEMIIQASQKAREEKPWILEPQMKPSKSYSHTHFLLETLCY